MPRTWWLWKRKETSSFDDFYETSLFHNVPCRLGFHNIAKSQRNIYEYLYIHCLCITVYTPKKGFRRWLLAIMFCLRVRYSVRYQYTLYTLSHYKILYLRHLYPMGSSCTYTYTGGTVGYVHSLYGSGSCSAHCTGTLPLPTTLWLGAPKKTLA